MSFVIEATPVALRSIDALRGRARDSYQRKLVEIAARGCEAFGYRLTGADPHRICAVHLYADYRLIAALFDDDRIVILLVGQHESTRTGDIYRELFEDLGLPVPGGARTKPPCCEGLTQSEIDQQEDLERLFAVTKVIAERAKEYRKELAREQVELFLSGPAEYERIRRRSRN